MSRIAAKPTTTFDGMPIHYTPEESPLSALIFTQDGTDSKNELHHAWFVLTDYAARSVIAHLDYAAHYSNDVYMTRGHRLPAYVAPTRQYASRRKARAAQKRIRESVIIGGLNPKVYRVSYVVQGGMIFYYSVSAA